MNKRRIWLISACVGVFLLACTGLLIWHSLRSWPNFVGMTRSEVVREAIRCDLWDDMGKGAERVLVIYHGNSRHHKLAGWHLKSERDLADTALINATYWTIEGKLFFNALEMQFGSDGCVVAQRLITEWRE